MFKVKRLHLNNIRVLEHQDIDPFCATSTSQHRHDSAEECFQITVSNNCRVIKDLFSLNLLRVIR